jgi:predicted Fe-Mo cluster-binding NifX family protein
MAMSRTDPSRRTIACIPVTPDGQVGGGFGRAPRVAIARTQGGALTDWQEIPVGWDVLHDTGTEGGHHARVARFLMDHAVELVVVSHLGDGMRRMLEGMGVALVTGAEGEARSAVLEAAAGT